MTAAAEEDPRARYLAKHTRYNTSSKDQRRNMRYESAHPERRLRWEPARNALNHSNGPPPITAAELGDLERRRELEGE